MVLAGLKSMINFFSEFKKNQAEYYLKPGIVLTTKDIDPTRYVCSD
jgi:hypothetical protein